MSKHTLSPAPLPSAKRLRTSAGPSESFCGRSFSLDGSLSDEVVLCIFSYLSWVDLCAAQATNRNWYRLAADNELWRKLYLTVYGRSRLRGAFGFPARSDGKEMKHLPGGVRPTPFKDWKGMFRISSNWRRGRCAVEQLNCCPASSTVCLEQPYQSHILLAGPLVITASSQPSDQPTIQIVSPSGTKHTLACESQRGDSAFQITALALDQSPPLLGHIRIVSCFSTGEFAIFSINPTHLAASSTKLNYCPNRGNINNPSIVQAAYHHPLLVALSHTFNLFVYDLSNGTARHAQTLTSFTSFPPTSLVLSTPSPMTYKLVLVYAIPVYPSHWSVGATELLISGAGMPPNLSLPSMATASLPAVKPMMVLSTRTTRAIDIPQGWVDEQKLRSMREQWSRKVSRVAGTQTDGKWIVLAPGAGFPFPGSPSTASVTSTASDGLSNSSTTLQLYRLHFPAQSTSIGASSPKLTFVRSLHGQIGTISSLALADGRCVSFGQNGSLWVWDLEAAIGVEVSVPTSENSRVNTGLIQGAVAFDDRRIITTETTGVVMRRFDV